MLLDYGLNAEEVRFIRDGERRFDAAAERKRVRRPSRAAPVLPVDYRARIERLRAKVNRLRPRAERIAIAKARIRASELGLSKASADQMERIAVLKVRLEPYLAQARLAAAQRAYSEKVARERQLRPGRARGEWEARCRAILHGGRRSAPLA